MSSRRDAVPTDDDMMPTQNNGVESSSDRGGLFGAFINMFSSNKNQADDHEAVDEEAGNLKNQSSRSIQSNNDGKNSVAGSQEYSSAVEMSSINRSVDSVNRVASADPSVRFSLSLDGIDTDEYGEVDQDDDEEGDDDYGDYLDSSPSEPSPRPPLNPRAPSSRVIDPDDPVYVPMEQRTLKNTKDTSFRIRPAKNFFGNFFSRFESAVTKSRFHNWTREELIDLLVFNEVELPSEHLIPYVTLRDQCESLFEVYEMPDKVPPLTVREHYLLEKYTRLIQYKFFYERGLINRADSAADDYLDDDEDGMIRVQPSTDSMFSSIDADSDAGLRRLGSLSTDAESQAELAKPKRCWCITSLVSSAYRRVTGACAFCCSTSASATAKPTRDEKRAALRKKLSRRTLEVMDKTWQPASEERAMKTADYLHPRKGGKGGTKFDAYRTYTGRHCVLNGFGENCDLWEEGIISEFSPYGPGITNYFKFLKWLYWVFLMLSVLSIPELVINIYSTSDVSSGLTDLSKTMVGNVANTVVNGTVSIPLPGCNSALFGQDNCILNRSTLGNFYCWLDICMSAFILIAFGWLWYFEREEEKRLDSLTLYTSMYSIAVTNLPPDVTEADLREHFTKLLRKMNEQVTISTVYSYSSNGLNNTSSNSSSNTNNLMSIQGVTIAMNSAKHIELLNERGKWLHKKATRVHFYRFQCDEAQQRFNDNFEKYDKTCYQLLKQFEKDNKEIDEQLADLDIQLKELERQPDVPVVAFVTFDYILSALLIKDVYEIRLVDYVIRYVFVPCLSVLCYCGCDGGVRERLANHKKDLLLKGRMINVTTAPEPGSIIWEHLEVNKLKRLAYRSVTLFGAILLVIISILVTFGAKVLQQKAIISGGNSICPTNFQDLSTTDQEAVVSSDAELLHCYCDQFNLYQQQQLDLCKNYMRQQISSQIYTFFASFIVLAISTLIEIVIRYFADFEKHHSQDTKEKSIFLRLFYLKYLNTSVIFLINNNQQIMKGLYNFFLFNAKHKINQFNELENITNFSSKWYDSIGVSILIVQIGNILSSQCNTLYDYMLFHYNLKTNKKLIRFKTQREINKYFTGPEFELGLRYSSILSTFCVLLTFSSGIPLLHFIGAISFATQFIVDKYTFVELYRTPHRYATVIGKMSTIVIPFAVCLHLGMSIWMLSNSEIFNSSHLQENQLIQTDSTSNDHNVGAVVARRVEYTQSFPLFVMFLIVSGSLFAYGFIKICREIYFRIEILFEGNLQQKMTIAKYTKEFHHKAAPAYSRAVYSNYISGLASYNILLNPIYKEKFGISWKFALTHSHLRDVRRSTLIADEEDDIIKAHNTLLRKYRQRRSGNHNRVGNGSASHSTVHHRKPGRPQEHDRSAILHVPSTVSNASASDKRKSQKVDQHELGMMEIARQVEEAELELHEQLRDSECFVDDAADTAGSRPLSGGGLAI